MSKEQEKASNFRSVCTIVITSVGLGILELPPSVAKVGPLNFGILMAFTGIASWWTIQLLHRCLVFGEGMFQSYTDIGFAAYGTKGKVFVGLCMHVTLTGICACLLVLLGNTMQTLLPLGGLLESWSREFWVVVGALVAQPFVWIKSIGKLGIVSAVGVASVFFLGALIVVGSVREIAARPGDSLTASFASFDPFDIGFAIVMLCFSFGSIPAIPAVFSGMKHPEDFRKVSAVAYLVIAFITGLVAYAGYFAWGSNMQNTDVLDLLSGGSSKDASGRRKLDWLGFCSLVLAVAVVLTHVVVLIRPVADAAEAAGSGFAGPWLRKLYRSLPSAVMLTLGLVFKKLGLLMLLVGSISVMLITLIIPLFLYHRVHNKYRGVVPNAAAFWTVAAFIILSCSYASAVGILAAGQLLSK